MFGGERSAGDFLVVEVKDLAADDLVVLVAFAGDEYEIAATRLRDRLVDCRRGSEILR